MDDEYVRRVVRLPLIVPENRTDDLHATRTQVAHCQQRTSDSCWDEPKQPTDLITTYKHADDALYDSLREEPNGLHANLVQKAMKDVTGNLGAAKSNWQARDRVNQPSYHERRDDGSYAITYDHRSATFH